MRHSRQIGIGGALALTGAAAFAIAAWARGKPRATEIGRIAYTPTNTLKGVGEDIWIVDGEPISAMGLVMPLRMTVIRLGDGTLLLHSAIRWTPDLAAKIAELGPVRHLVAPTIAHWKFLKDWQRACPDAVSWAVPGLRDRLQVRASGLRIERELDVTAPKEWSSDLQQGLVRGTGFVEAYLFHKPSRTLVLADLVENLEPARLPPVSAAAARLARATDGRPAAHVRAAILLGGSQARQDIREMVALEPEKVVFAHGDWFADNGAAQLRRAFGSS